MEESDFKSKFTPSSEVLQRLFEDGKSPLAGPFLRWKLWMKWAEVVGPTISKATEPVGFQRGCLWVWVKNSSWMQQLIFMRAEIQSTVNQKMGTEMVRMIRFTLDRREVPADALAQDEIRQVISKITPVNGDDR